jgi:hypothetical protein
MFFLTVFFINSQTFAMMFKSGDWAGHDIIGISILSNNKMEQLENNLHKT